MFKIFKTLMKKMVLVGKIELAHALINSIVLIK
jgi:hypothetical protein